VTKKQIQEIVGRVLHVHPDNVHVSRETTTVYCSFSVTYDDLLVLSQELGTTKINFDYQQGEPGYSSWTPGTDDSFSFTIGVGAVK
jgi:hypothetical protein